MAKPPATPPASDLDGVDEDAVRNIDAAHASGQDAGDLARAADQARGRPAHSDDDSRDDRST